MAHLRFLNPLKKGSFFQCGGSILDKRTILTAAHCVHDEAKKVRDVKYAEVYLGGHNKFDDEDDKFGVTEIIYDKKYKSLEYDIAILKLDKDITYTKKIGPICVPSSDDTPFNRLTVAGWGVLNGAGRPTQVLREVDVDYVERK